MNSQTILVADDEPQIRRVMRTVLAAQGYTVLEAHDGEEALELLRKERADLILLDVNMPRLDGLAACREIRRSSDVPIIMLTVRNTEHDKVAALDAGADDYVVKPFGVEELLARIRAALRRSATVESIPAIKLKDLGIDFDRREVTVNGETVRLTPKEFDLLRLLVCNKEKPWRTGDCCRPYGDRITAKRRNTCACSSINYARKSSLIPATRATSRLIHGLDTGLKFPPNRRPGAAVPSGDLGPLAAIHFPASFFG